MSGTSEKSMRQLSLFGSTISRVWVGGSGHSGLLDGLKAAKSGPAHARASQSVLRVTGKEQPTNVTYGPLFSGSSPSAGLQRSLENRLRARMVAYGSPEYELIWRHWDMQWGPQICALRALVRRMSGRDFTGWPSPTAKDRDSSGASQPRTATHHPGTTLTEAARMAGWPSPSWHDGRRPGADMKSTQRRNLNRDVVRLTGWGSPSSRDWKDSSGMSIQGVNPDGSMRTRLDQLGRQVVLSVAPMADGGASRLNPGFSLWLMTGDGVIREVIRSCPQGSVPSRPQVTRSASRSRRNSFAR
jgi:hypothetical protein